jgi:NADPH:quinone reductase-like Zn-dependent oxidoreductase
MFLSLFLNGHFDFEIYQNSDGDARSGFEVITTCSPRNFDYVKELGADKVFDTYSPDLGAQIRAYTNDKLYYAWDCVGGPDASSVCCDALASSAPDGQKLRLGKILPIESRPRDDVTYTFSLGYTAWGKEIPSFNGESIPAKPEHYEFTVKWLQFSEKLLAEKKWKPHRQEVREGGLEGVLQGLKDMKDGKVSGVKLVYRVGEP